MKILAVAALFGAAFGFGISGYGGHSAAVSLSATQLAPDRVVSTGPEKHLTMREQVWATQPAWMWALSRCIREHESINIGHYKAIYHDASYSTASGAYQMLDRFWQGNAAYAQWHGVKVAKKYERAYMAPPWVQDVVFIHSIEHGGIKAWRGTGCRGTS